MPKTVNGRELTCGEFDFNAMNSEQLDDLLLKIKPGYDPIEFSVAGKRKHAYQLCTRHELASDGDVDKYVQEQAKAKLGDVDDEFVNLSREELEDLHRRAGMQTKFESYADPGDNWKLAKRLHKKCQALNLTLDQVRVREPRKTGRVGLPITFPDGIPTTKPDGVSPEAEEILNVLCDTFEDTVVGRNRGGTPRAMALITFAGLPPVRVQISMPKDYAVERDN